MASLYDISYAGGFVESHSVRDEHVLTCWQAMKRDFVFFCASLPGFWCCNGVADDLANLEVERVLLNQVSKEEDLAVDAASLEETSTNYEAQMVYQETIRRKKLGLVPVKKAVMARKLKVSTRVVIDVRAAVVAKLGYLQNTPSNVTVVDKVARKIMRDNNFRNEVVAIHLQHILNAYFNCQAVHDRSGGAHQRMPKWLLRTLGYDWKPAEASA